MQDRLHLDMINEKPRASNAWRGMVLARQTVGEGCRRLVRNGRDTRFWKDIWICDSPLLALWNSNPDPEDIDVTVADMWNEGRGWDWERIQDSLPSHVTEKLELCCIDGREGEEDGYGWRLTALGKFSVSSAYYELTKTPTGLQDGVWKKIWKIKAPMKMVVFLWLVRHQRIPCNVERLCALCVEARRRRLSTW